LNEDTKKRFKRSLIETKEIKLQKERKISLILTSQLFQKNQLPLVNSKRKILKKEKYREKKQDNYFSGTFPLTDVGGSSSAHWVNGEASPHTHAIVNNQQNVLYVWFSAP